MTWGVCKDVYINLDIDLEVLNVILGEYVLPQFNKDIKMIRAIEKSYTVTTTALSGDVYHEHVVIEVSSKKRDFNFYLLFVELDIIFKLFGLTPNDYRLRY